jgi:hypothetical protein
MEINKNTKGKVQRSKCGNLLKVLDAYEKENSLLIAAANFGKKASLKLAITQTIKVLLQRHGVDMAKQLGRKAGIVIDLLWPTDSADSTIEGGFLHEIDHLHKELEKDQLNIQVVTVIVNNIRNQAQKMIKSNYYGDAKECYLALNKITQLLDRFIAQINTQQLA